MTQAQHTILIVDDDVRLRRLLQEYLHSQGFGVTSSANADEARTQITASKNPPDLALFDVMMPTEDGLALLAWVRTHAPQHLQNLPIIMLTARSETEHRIAGLKSGADDYLGKPFAPEELLLRIRNLLKHSEIPDNKSIIRFGAYAFDRVQRTLTRKNFPVALTTIDRDLLAVLVDHLGAPLTREDLANHMGVSLSPRTIDVQIARLRQKIEDDPKKPIYLVTQRHKGYALKS